jgi:predicted nucleic acid-binding protein
VIVVDISIWVDYFTGQTTRETEALDSLLGKQELLMGDLILTEVLQGFRHERHFQQALRLLQAFPVVTMLGPDMAVRSTNNYRTLRRRGVTVRKTIDVMIGTYCLAEDHALLCSDRDFHPMIQHLGLLSVL